MLKDLRAAVITFYCADRALLLYGGTAVLLAAALFINYSSLINLQWVVKQDNAWMWLGHYLMLYGGIYYASAMLGAVGSEKNYLRNPLFWLLSLAFIVLAIIPKLSVVPLVNIHIHPEWSIGEKLFAHKSQFFVQQIVVAGFGLVVLKMAVSKWMPLDFGLRWDWRQLRPYLVMLLIVSPLMVAASFLPDFQNAYPQYKPWVQGNMAFGLTDAERTGIFSLCYATGFLAVELLFRGALTIAMVHIMGMRAVVPMAAFYCAFHFGKPLGEAVASIFGGYLLGVLAIHGRSIGGGIIVHLGVALLMELMGHLQHINHLP